MKKIRLILLFIVCILLNVSCDGIEKKDYLIEIVKDIVIKELELQNLEISYDEFIRTTDVYFDKYVEFINKNNTLFGYRNENDEIVKYKMKDIIGISDKELEELRKLKEREIGFQKVEKVELFVSEIFEYEDSKYVFAKKVLKLSEGREFEFFYWFNFKEIENQPKIYGFETFYHEELLERFITEEIIFDKYYELVY